MGTETSSPPGGRGCSRFRMRSASMSKTSSGSPMRSWPVHEIHYRWPAAADHRHQGQRSDTGVPADDFSSAAWKKVTHGGGPFNLPTDIAFAPSGEMFMTDGYGNARVHKFSADGKHLFSWGEPGNAPGQFNLPHGVWIDRRGRVLIADRENDRVQIFDQEGKLLTIWPTELLGPAFVYVDDDDTVYI